MNGCHLNASESVTINTNNCSKVLTENYQTAQIPAMLLHFSGVCFKLGGRVCKRVLLQREFLTSLSVFINPEWLH